MKGLLVIVLAAVVAGAVVSAGSARSTKFVFFRMPSKNIACAYMSGGGQPVSLRCDIYSGLKPKPSGRCREGDWAAVYMTRRGKARPICISDSVYKNGERVLRYGQTWRYNGFTCKSARIGLTCSNAAGHGFFLSRQRYSVH